MNRSTAAPMDFESNYRTVNSSSSLWLSHVENAQRRAASSGAQTDSAGPMEIEEKVKMNQNPLPTTSIAHNVHASQKKERVTAAGELFTSVIKDIPATESVFKFGLVQPKQQRHDAYPIQSHRHHGAHKRRRQSASFSDDEDAVYYHTMKPKTTSNYCHQDYNYPVTGYRQHGTQSNHTTSFSILKFLATIVPLSLAMLLTHDLYHKIQHHHSSHLKRIQSCTVSYETNHCYSPLPALKSLCEEWMDCIHSSEPNVPWMALFSETVGQTVERFLDGLSLRSLVFIGVIAIATGIVGHLKRMLFGIARSVPLKNQQPRTFGVDYSDKVLQEPPIQRHHHFVTLARSDSGYALPTEKSSDIGLVKYKT